MGSFSLVHWLILAVVLVLVLGGGRFSNMMGDVAKGIKQFKKGMAEEDEVPVGRRLETQKQAEPAFDADGRAREAVPVREAAPLRDADRVREDR